MEKKAFHLPNEEELPVQKKTTDFMINALIEKRRLQQGALIKIITSMDKEAANRVGADPVSKKNSKPPKK